MTWIKLDDTIPDHDRMVRAGDRAAWLWVCGLCWSSRHLADGKVPYDVIPRLTGQDDAHELALRLVECGLWARTKTGFTIRKYSDFQRTKAQVRADREGSTERKRKSRAAVKSHRDDADVTPPDTETVTETDSPQPPARRGAKDCVRCQGRGTVYSATAGRDAQCVCVPEVPELKVVGGSA